MTTCAYHNNSLCVSRMGEPVTTEIIANPMLIEDRHFCRYKKGMLCTVNQDIRLDSQMKKPSSTVVDTPNPYALRSRTS